MTCYKHPKTEAQTEEACSTNARSCGSVCNKPPLHTNSLIRTCIVARRAVKPEREILNRPLHAATMSKAKVSLKSSEDVFKRLSQDPHWAALADRVRIGYMDRVVGGFLEMPLRGFVPISKGGEMPFHRLWWFRLQPQAESEGPNADGGQHEDSAEAGANAARDGSITGNPSSHPAAGDPAAWTVEDSCGDIVAPGDISREELQLTANLLWDREARLDLVFRSGDTGAVLSAERKLRFRPKHQGRGAPSSSSETAIHRRWVQSQAEAAKNLQHVEEQRQLRVAAAAQKRRSKAKSASKVSLFVYSVCARACISQYMYCVTQKSAAHTQPTQTHARAFCATLPSSQARKKALKDPSAAEGGETLDSTSSSADEATEDSGVGAQLGASPQRGFTFQTVPIFVGGCHPAVDHFGKNLKLVTQNVLTDCYAFTGRERSRERWRRLLNFLAEKTADIYVLQEVTSAFVEVLQEVMTSETHLKGFHYAHSTFDTACGQLILSRFPMAAAGELSVGLAKSVLFCEILTGSGSAGSSDHDPLLVGALHLTSDHHRENHKTRLLQLARIRDFLENYEHEMVNVDARTLQTPLLTGRQSRVILAGDWNEDSLPQNPQHHRTRRILRFLEEPEVSGFAGLKLVVTDGQATYDPGSNALAAEISSSNDRRPRRLDHVALSNGRLRQVGVASTIVPTAEGNGGFLSDHSGVVCEFMVVTQEGGEAAAGSAVLPRLVSSEAKCDEHPGGSARDPLYGFAWLVPDCMEPVFDHRDDRMNGLVDDFNRHGSASLLYSLSCSGRIFQPALALPSSVLEGISPARIHGRFTAFFNFIQAIRQSADAAFEAWPPHVTLVPLVVDLDSHAADDAIGRAIAKYLDVPNDGKTGDVEVGMQEIAGATSEENEARKELNVHLALYFRRIANSMKKNRGASCPFVHVCM